MAEDLRVRQTKHAIKSAFVELVNQDGFANITIKAIADKAIINRQTFYNYYQDKYDLTEHLNNELLVIFKTIITHRVESMQGTASLPLLNDFYKSEDFAQILANRKAITALLSIQYDQNSFKNRLQELVVNIIQEKLNMKFTNLDVQIIGSLYVDIISFIAKNDVQPTTQDLEELRKLVTLILQ